MTVSVTLVIARKPWRGDGGRGRHPSVSFYADFTRAAPTPSRLQMGGNAREYAASQLHQATLLVYIPLRCSLLFSIQI